MANVFDFCDMTPESTTPGFTLSQSIPARRTTAAIPKVFNTITEYPFTMRQHDLWQSVSPRYTRNRFPRYICLRDGV